MNTKSEIIIIELVDSIASKMKVEIINCKPYIPVEGFRDSLWEGVLSYFGLTREDALKAWRLLDT